MMLGNEIIIVSMIFIFILNVVYFYRQKMNFVEEKPYELILIFSLVETILSVIMRFICSSNSFEILQINYYLFFNAINKVLACLYVIVFWELLSYTVLITYKKSKNNIKLILIPSIMFIISFIIILFFTNIKLVEQNGIINIEGTTITIKHIFVTVLMFMSLLLSLLNIKKITKKHLSIFLILIVIALINIFSFIQPGLKIDELVLAFICYIMYFTIEDSKPELINKLELAKNQVEQSNRAKIDFLSSMSHEIRTPLNAIVGLSEIIKTNDNIDEIHEDAKYVVDTSQNLLEIVNGILDISKIEANKMEIEEVEYNPIKVFNKIKNLINSRIGEKDIELRYNLSSNLPKRLYGDKSKLKQIISNILVNAVKYTEKGYIDFNVSCINEKDNCNLKIEVIDTGRGIKKNQMSVLFKKFQRLEEDKNTTIQGTGLGLAITKSLTEMMNGKITVNSKYGEGSNFTVYISQKILEENSISKINEIKEEFIKYENKKILVVDDNKLNIKVATKILESLNLIVDSCESGFECIEKIKNNENFDVIFMDIMMPKMTGVETLKKLKKLENFNTPVVAFTADSMQSQSTKYIEVGFSEYLSKPIDKNKLKKVLNNCLTNKIKVKKDDMRQKHQVLNITEEDIEQLNKKLQEMNEKLNESKI